MSIIFKEVEKNNWEECIDLKVNEEQRNFVSANWYSILQSKFEDKLYPTCIYDDETMIGFLMYDFEMETGRWELCRFMIHKKYQHKGYGKTSLVEILKVIKNKLGNIKFYLSVDPENIIAKNLYKSVGFESTGEIMWDEEVMVIEL